MSTELGKLNDKQLTRFYGGEDRGFCIQITGKEGYVQLSVAEMIALMPEFKIAIDVELEKEVHDCDKAIEDYKELKRTIVNDMREVAKMAIAQPVLNMASLLVLSGDKIDKSEAEDDD